jgi:hypothetical protein
MRHTHTHTHTHTHSLSPLTQNSFHGLIIASQVDPGPNGAWTEVIYVNKVEYIVVELDDVEGIVSQIILLLLLLSSYPMSFLLIC